MEYLEDLLGKQGEAGREIQLQQINKLDKLYLVKLKNIWNSTFWNALLTMFLMAFKYICFS